MFVLFFLFLNKSGCGGVGGGGSADFAAAGGCSGSSSDRQSANNSTIQLHTTRAHCSSLTYDNKKKCQQKKK